MKIYRNSLNLFDKLAADIDDTGYIQSSGEIATSINFITSGYIDVRAYNEVTISGMGTGNAPAYCKYDSTKTYMEGYNYSQRETITINTLNASYIRFAIRKTEIDTAMCNAGSSALPYEPYNVVDWYGYKYKLRASGAWSEVDDKKRSGGAWT